MTGVLGPGNNAHGPDENISIPYFLKLTCGVAYIVSQHYYFENKPIAPPS